MSKTYMRVFVNARIYRAQSGHLRANLLQIKLAPEVAKQMDTKLEEAGINPLPRGDKL